MSPRTPALRALRARPLALAGASLLALCAAAAAQEEPVTLPDIYVTATRIGSGVAGASTTVITAQDIADAPDASLPALLGLQPGVQTQHVFGGANGANAVVDIRGFGAAGASNTLVLVDGRRINDLDIQGIDFASIPRDSIERIEITRGGSGAVLYGDGAVGGVINIVTKKGAPSGASGRVEIGAGSWGQREANVSTRMAHGAHSLTFFGAALGSQGWRENNEYRQFSGVTNYAYSAEWGSLNVNVGADNQHVGLPGARLVDRGAGIDLLRRDPRGATTPYDFANKQGVSGVVGLTINLAPGAQLIVDGGVRQKTQQAGFFDSTSVPGAALPTNYVRATLTTASISPRLKLDASVFGMPLKSLLGLDYYDSDYGSPRAQGFGDAPIHVYALRQDAASAYAMNTLSVAPSTDVSFGARLQRTAVTARDRLDVTAPGGQVCYPPFGCFSDTQGEPLDRAETNHAWHVGFEHRFTPAFAVFGRAARSFRTPNVDERIGMTPDITSIPTTFDLRTQTSQDYEAGARGRWGAFDLQGSAYWMDLRNEIHYSPATFSNVNLDPTRRRGVELIGGWQATETLRLKAGYAYTRATFREGVFAGRDVPLVSRDTASLGFDWSVWDRALVVSGAARYVGARRMDNDQANLQPKIPGFFVFDARVGGEIDRYFWSLSVQNLFDKAYYDYAVASAFTIGRFNAYPQTGRTVVLRAGATF
ncbi:MAG TPA: TonB-dependent receptor [Beijerinckiaceae bacterium]